MKFYTILLVALILQVLIFLPLYRGVLEYYHPEDVYIFGQMDRWGVGPYLHYKFLTDMEVYAPLPYGGGAVYWFVTVYVGDIALDIILALAVIIVKRIEKNK